jgi:tetratricopeptide (TPR) repeat protein
MLQESFRKVTGKKEVFKQFFSWKRGSALAPNMVRSFKQQSLPALLLACVCLLTTACSAQEPSWYVDLEQARKLCATGNLAESKALLAKTQEAIAKAGQCPAPYLVYQSPVTYTGELASLADCIAFHGQVTEAEALLNSAIKLGENDPQNANLLAPLRALASVYEKNKQFALAEPIRIRITTLPHASPEDTYQLADLYTAERKFAQAESIYMKNLALEEAQPVKSASTAVHMNELAHCYFLEGKLDQSEKLYRAALDYNPLAHESERGDGFTAKDLRPMAELYVAKGDLEKAEAYYRQCLSGTLEYTPAEQAKILSDYAKVLRSMKRLNEAENREAQASQKSLEAANSPIPYVQTYYE